VRPGHTQIRHSMYGTSKGTFTRQNNGNVFPLCFEYRQQHCKNDPVHTDQ